MKRNRTAVSLLFLLFCAAITATRVSADPLPHIWLTGAASADGVYEVIAEKLAPQFHCTRGAWDAALIHTTPRLDVLLLDEAPAASEDIRAYAARLLAITHKARQKGMEVVWCNRDMKGKEDFSREATNAMAAANVVIFDFASFTRAQKVDSGIPSAQRQADFFAEALDQWWAACATHNPHTEHIELWPSLPPEFQHTGPEKLNSYPRVTYVDDPELIWFSRNRIVRHDNQPIPAVIFFPGGGYQFLGFPGNARELAERLAPEGIAVIGLKYRTGRSWEIPLLDAQRALRLVRHRAAGWGLDPNRIGIAGTSAGANLALRLVTRFTPGTPSSPDLVERESSRPDFVAVFSSWNFGTNDCPFVFGSNTPPIFLRHAQDDPAFSLAEKIVAELRAKNVVHDARFLQTGGHGAFDFRPGSVGTDWPDEFLPWLKKLGFITSTTPRPTP